MKSVLLSMVVFALVAAIGAGGLFAYFSDTETSEGNTFQAGNTDLAVDVNWYDDGREQNPWPEEIPLIDPSTTADIKPGHRGESTISLHAYCVNAELLMKFFNFINDENGSAGPEITLGDAPDDPLDDLDGELASYLWLRLWEDNGLDGEPVTGDEGEGDNIWQEAERIVWESYFADLMACAMPDPDPDIDTSVTLLTKIVLEHCHVFYLGFEWYFDPDVAGEPDVNLAQSDTFGCDISFTITDY